MKTIIVDDEYIMLKSFRRLSAGIEAIELAAEFQDPAEALSRAAELSPDLAILDVELPKMKGPELAAELKKLCPGILVVFVTAYDEYRETYAEMGGCGCILKPYSKDAIETMAASMEKLLKERR